MQTKEGSEQTFLTSDAGSSWLENFMAKGLGIVSNHVGFWNLGLHAS